MAYELRCGEGLFQLQVGVYHLFTIECQHMFYHCIMLNFKEQLKMTKPESKQDSPCRGGASFRDKVDLPRGENMNDTGRSLK